MLPAARALEEAYAWVRGRRRKARDEALRELRPSIDAPRIVSETWRRTSWTDREARKAPETQPDRGRGLMTDSFADSEDHVLDDGRHLFVGTIPDSLRPDAAGFEILWATHPEDYHVVLMRGRPVNGPR